LEIPDQLIRDYGPDGGIKTESLLYLFRRNDRDPEDGYSTLPAHMNSDVNQYSSVEEDRDMITIYLMDPTRGAGMPLKLKRETPLSNFFSAYSRQMNLPASRLNFFNQLYGELPYDCQLSPEALGLDNGSTIMVNSNMDTSIDMDMQAPLPTPPQHLNEIDLIPVSDSGTAMAITVKGIGQDVTAKIIKETTSLGLLFISFAEKCSVEDDLLLYICNGKTYSPFTDKTADQCGIEEGDVIHVVWRADEEKKARVNIAKFISIRVRQRRIRSALKTITEFVWRNVAFKRRSKLRKSAQLVQKIFRGHSARRIHGDEVQARLSEFRHFTEVWGPTADFAAQQASSPLQTLTGWSLVRDGIHLKKTVDIDEDGNLAETDAKLNKALSGALQESACGLEEQAENEVESDSENCISENTMNNAQDNLVNIDWSQFQVTHHVCKFLKNGDAKFREIFVKKIKQLGKGERSHKLQKPLQGCESVIYETYLENKSGWRILWTQEDLRLVIWFVCQHKSVSRLARLIDDAKNRTARQQLPASFISEMENGAANHEEEKMNINLDPIGNVPLKLYDISLDRVNDLVDPTWTPQMHLTKEERDVIDAKGTVCESHIRLLFNI
jgi:hypothetical protein